MYGRESEPSSSNSTGNAGRSGASSPWSVRAEFTIHRGNNSSPVETTTRSATIAPVSEATGVRMTYSFTPSHNRINPNSSSMTPPATYGFQRGNFMFTSTPPARSLIPVRSQTIPRTAYSHVVQREQYLFPNRTNYSDSGYASEQVSSQSHSSLPSRQPSNSDKRCKSTYNIVLSSANRHIPQYHQRQQPQSHLPCPRPWSSYYQTFQQQQQHVTPCCRFSTVPEVCEDCVEAAIGGSSPFATHFCTRLSERTMTTAKTGLGKVATETVSKDAASQTTDIEAKNSPIATRRKVRKKVSGALSGSSGRDELKNNNFGRLSRMPASTKSPSPPSVVAEQHSISDSSTTTNTRDDNSEKRKRTVHIDVYCTGTDDDPNDEDDDNNSNHSSSSSSSNISAENDNLKQDSVFENKDVRITHTQAKSNVLPRGFQDEKAFLKRASERRCESFRHAPMRMPSLASSKGYESDDVLSSLYPSQFSSYSRLRDFESSVPWSAASSSVGIPDDSASATSWKDTVSDMESLRNSKASITPCDSFEYADSVDRERIKRMEAMWSKKSNEGRNFKGKNWRSPHIERKHLLQGKMMKDYMEKHPPVGWSSESSVGDSGSDGEESIEEVGWSFVSSEDTSVVKGKLTLPALGGVNKNQTIDKTDTSHILSASTTDQEISQSELIREVKTTIFRDKIGPFGSMTPSPPPSKLQSRMTSPFTTPQGEKTDHIVKASIFGRVINTFRKPGHHVGPAKNPACSCEHCRRHFEELSARGRSRSLDTVQRRNHSREPSTTN